MALGSQDLSHQDRQLLEATLQRAASLLRKSRWSRDAPARNQAGAEVDPADARAKAFCIAGAFLRAGTCLDTATVRVGMALLHRVACDMTRGEAADVFALNDDPRTAKRDALAMLDRAAALAMEDRSGSPVARGTCPYPSYVGTPMQVPIVSS
jgi:hypothetical protein